MSSAVLTAAWLAAARQGAWACSAAAVRYVMQPHHCILLVRLRPSFIRLLFDSCPRTTACAWQRCHTAPLATAAPCEHALPPCPALPAPAPAPTSAHCGVAHELSCVLRAAATQLRLASCLLHKRLTNALAVLQGVQAGSALAAAAWHLLVLCNNGGRSCS
jgi:hypothetical protein